MSELEQANTLNDEPMSEPHTNPVQIRTLSFSLQDDELDYEYGDIDLKEDILVIVQFYFCQSINVLLRW